MNYKIKEITPYELQCGIGACPAIYEGIRKVSRNEECGLGACPTIYAGTKKLSKNEECVMGACPAVYSGTRKITKNECSSVIGCPTVYKSKKQKENVYLIIGKKINPSKVGLGELEKKIGKGEVLIEVPRTLIDKMKK